VGRAQGTGPATPTAGSSICSKPEFAHLARRTSERRPLFTTVEQLVGGLSTPVVPLLPNKKLRRTYAPPKLHAALVDCYF
jgi:hypothetical protein